MIKITEKFIKELEIYKEINLHSNMGWTVTPGAEHCCRFGIHWKTAV